MQNALHSLEGQVDEIQKQIAAYVSIPLLCVPYLRSDVG